MIFFEKNIAVPPPPPRLAEESKPSPAQKVKKSLQGPSGPGRPPLKESKTSLLETL